MKKAKSSSSITAPSQVRDKLRALEKQLAVAKGRIEQARKEARLLKSDAAKLGKVTDELKRTKEALKEALERQTASSEILHVVARSVADTQPVFQAILASLLRLFEGFDATVWTVREGLLVSVVRGGATLDASVATKIPVTGEHPYAVALRDHSVLRLDDVTNARDISEAARADLLGRNRKAVVLVPLVRDGSALGALSVSRATPHSFTAVQVELLKNFADQATIAIENARLFNETKDALERQTATADVLRAISTSPTDTQPVFEAILERAAKLCGAESGLLFRYADGAFHALATRIPNPEFAATFREPRRPAPGSKTGLGQLIRLKHTVHMPDLQVDAATAESDPLRMATLRGGMRSWLGVPLLKEGELIGAIVIYGYEPQPFSQAQIALLETFAEQSVIAMENVRLFNETKEALEQQTAISEILSVMSDSPSDVLPVLDAVAERAMRICESKDARIFLVDADKLRYTAGRGDVKSGELGMTRPISRGLVLGRAVIDKVPVHVEDLSVVSEEEFPLARQIQREFGHHTTLAVPLLREGKALGVILLRRIEVRPFTDKQIALLKTFSDQAAIAIENVRLFNETKEALERQTATAEILKVIASSPTDVQPVFDVIVERAVKLCGARFGRVYRYDGSIVQMVAGHGLSAGGLQQVQRVFPRPAADDTIVGRVILARQPYFLADIQRDATVPILSRQVIEALNTRSQVTIPMLRTGESIGAITMGWDQPDGFNDRQVALLQTFADQAVIAIENVRLFNETKEALERQTATAEVLRVISNSPTDTQPVFEAIAQSGLRLFPGAAVAVALPDGDQVRAAAIATEDPELAVAWRARFPVPLARHQMHGAAILDRRLIDVPDAEAEVDGPMGPGVRNFLASSNKAITIVPMIRGESAIGAISIIRLVPGPLKPNQIALLQTFADQAVIAIENVRLFNETKEALDQQTATAGILGVISSSPTSVQPVFESILEHALRLCDANFGYVCTSDGNAFDHAVQRGLEDPVRAEAMKAFHETRVPGPNTALGRLRETKRSVHILDAREEPAYRARDPRRVAIVELAGARTMLAMPLLREGHVIGAVVIYRREVKAFTDKQTDLLRTFAAQAVIAIENVRLFNETKEALERQTATAEILRVISSSPTDVQPVFDAIVESCTRLLACGHSTLRLIKGDRAEIVASDSTERGTADDSPMPLNDDNLPTSRAIKRRKVVQIPDILAEGVSARIKQRGKQRSFRSLVIAPMLRENSVIGTIHVHRATPGSFTEKEVALLETFASQAVIAIENVRLFNETKEALERQTATAEILQVIGSSPTDTQPVFDAIVNSGVRLFPGAMISVARPDGGSVRAAAIAHEDTTMVAGWKERFTTPLSRDRLHAAAILDAKLIDFSDAEAEKDGPLGPGVRNFLLSGNRAVTIMPMLRGEGAIGAISVTRAVSGPLSDKQIAILRTFADQAVIAIENVRLFNETKESLERQTATAEILKVIASSPSDVQPVFDAIAQSCQTLFAGHVVSLTLVDGERIVPSAAAGMEVSDLPPWPLDRGSATGTCVLEGRTINIADVQETVDRFPRMKDLSIRLGYRSGLYVPLRRESTVIGTINVVRRTAGAFSEREIALAETFADQAVIAIQNVRLFNETKESLERQTATADILKVIASSPSDVQPVFDAISQSAQRLLGGYSASVARVDGDFVDLAAVSSDSEEGNEVLRRSYPRLIRGESGTQARAILSGKPSAVLDTESDPHLEPAIREMARTRGFRAAIGVPMMLAGAAVGAITVTRKEPGSFSDHQVALLQTFADQAVIAIENVRLFNETKEALERQTATAEILKVIASSPSDVRPVFDAIVNSVAQLFGRKAALRTVEAEGLKRRARSYDPTPGEFHGPDVEPLDRNSIVGLAILEGRTVQWADTWVDGAARYGMEKAKALAFRSIASAPLMREGKALGVISVSSPEPGALSDKQMELLSTFADQAVIAIENVRLFNETKESLERQTATAEILKVIASSPSDVQPVFDAIAASARRLLDGHAALVARRAGDVLELAAFTSTGEAGDSELGRLWPSKITGKGHMGQALLSAAPAWVEDVETDPSYSDEFRVGARARGMRSAVSVPMLREGEVIGVISVNRSIPGRFSDHQTNLLETFADQAVIAIENVRLFNETQEALARQEAAAQVLRSISESVSDTAPVFAAILDCCNRLIPSIDYVQVQLIEGSDRVRLVDHRFGQVRGAAPGKQDERRAELMAREAAHFPRPLAGSTLERALNQGRVVMLADTLDGPDTPPGTLVEARRWGHSYSQITVPLMREGRCIGAIEAFRRQLGGFEAKESSLLESFADQAVIAIENVRMFNETKEALERQTATAEILRVISSSPTDTQPVFDAIVQSAMRLFHCAPGISILEGGSIHLRAVAREGLGAQDLKATFDEMSKFYPLPFDPERNFTSRAIATRSPVEIADTEGPGVSEGARQLGRIAGYRSILMVPLVREGAGIGAIGLTFERPAVKLTDKQLGLVQTFADQAVIAIENVRLFKELQSRTEALTRSVGQLTALGEVGQAISSTLDLEKVLKTIATHAVRLTGLDGASIYEYDEATEEFRLQVAESFAPEFLQAIRGAPIRKGDGTVGGVAITLEPAQVPDILDDSYHSTRKELLVGAGYRAVLTVPLLREDHIIGALNVLRKTPGPFADEIVELLKTFATQSAMAIQNARLFREIAEKGKQLEEASRHKSQFLASMSHELRTPLNAILGFNEMILGDIYGEVPADMKEPLTDIQTSGKHLLRLINNVLDLAKIEAGRMELALDDYSVHDTVESVRSTLRPLAEAKGLELAIIVPPDIPLARGDGGRITQCLMNLAGNSLKFTKQGSVGISVALENGTLTYRVKDTGIGIPADKIGGLFTEFKQTDATIASEYGGTGLGLSITKKFIEMHGGRIWAESEPGSGSTFIFEIPLRAEEAKDA